MGKGSPIRNVSTSLIKTFTILLSLLGSKHCCYSSSYNPSMSCPPVRYTLPVLLFPLHKPKHIWGWDSVWPPFYATSLFLPFMHTFFPLVQWHGAWHYAVTSHYYDTTLPSSSSLSTLHVLMNPDFYRPESNIVIYLGGCLIIQMFPLKSAI